MKKGMAALPTILLIGGIILEITIALSLVVYFLSQSGYAAKRSTEALLSAQSGIDNTVSLIIRNKDLGSGNYSAIFNLDSSHSASIVACKNFLISTSTMACDLTKSNTGQTEIISTGSAYSINRRLQAFINVDALTGEVKIVSTQEISM